MFYASEQNEVAEQNNDFIVAQMRIIILNTNTLKKL